MKIVPCSINSHWPRESIHMGSETEAGCHAVPEEASNDGIDDAGSDMFMPCISVCAVCPDWACADALISLSTFCPRDEITKDEITRNCSTAFCMHHSRAIKFAVASTRLGDAWSTQRFR